MTQSTLNTLETLFQDPGPSGFLSSLSLRPEIEFWIGDFSFEGARHARIIEAMAHVPRPAILYVTKVADAEDWFERLTNEGFSRVGLVHGQTDSSRREEVLGGLHSGKLDIVVATSAFGLGIDYPHIRTIIHACVPETLDRFYQEVGRGGRDGRASLSLILPAYEDMGTAERLNNELVISVERGLQRWNSMFNHKDCSSVGNGGFVVRLDIAPGSSEDDIDMHGKLSTEWNARTLTLMARGGLIRLLGLSPDSDPRCVDREGLYQALEILDTEHLSIECWNRRIKPLRDSFWRANLANLEQMREFLQKRTCASELIASLYRIQGATKTWTVARTCGGCPVGRTPPGCVPVLETPAPATWPWPATPGVADQVKCHLDDGNRLVIFYDPGRMDRAWRRRLTEILDCLYCAGVRNLFLMGDFPPEFYTSLQKFAGDKPIYFCHQLPPAIGHLPPGPAVIFNAPGSPLNPSPLNARVAGSERFFFISEESEDPSRPGIKLPETYPGRHLHFDDFHRRITQ